MKYMFLLIILFVGCGRTENVTVEGRVEQVIERHGLLCNETEIVFILKDNTKKSVFVPSLDRRILSLLGQVVEFSLTTKIGFLIGIKYGHGLCTPYSLGIYPKE